jgi:glutathione synthase/RimK-type ligase-like ATP-grasp enzyme
MSIGKMIKHKEMLKRPELHPYLPETRWLTPSSTLRMMSTYSSLFIKPNHGSGGTGIIRAKRTQNGYEVRCGQNHKHVGTNYLYKAIQSYRKPSQQYLIQRGLQLAKYNGSIFDIRIYMQKPESRWIISGMVSRVAALNQFVTNYHKGGHAEPLQKVISTLFANNRSQVNECINRITNISYIIAETINMRHSIRELGIDLAIEKNGRLWIIEANSKPGHMLFTQLSDKFMMETIMSNKQLIQNLVAE